jgi:hypothetical protein
MITYFDVTSPLHIHCWFDLVEDFLYFPLKLWHCTWPHLTCFKLRKWMKSRPHNHLWIWRWCNILVMKTLNRERCALILKLMPLEFGIIAFFRTLTPWWFCYKSTPLLVMNPKPSMNVVTKLKTPPSSHGLQFPTLDTIVGCVVRFVNCLLIVRRIT